MYSGHDTTVAPILHTLGVFNGIAPPYASMIIFELFEGESLQVKFTLISELSLFAIRSKSLTRTQQILLSP